MSDTLWGRRHFQRDQKKTITTRVGEVCLSSAQYHVCQREQSWYPLEERLGIVDSFSPGLKRSCAAASVAEPFEGGMQLVKDILGWKPMSARSAEEQAEGYGEQLKKRRDQHVEEVMKRMGPDTKQRGKVLYVTCDGTTAHLKEEGWKEAKVGAVYELDAEGEATRISYTGGFEEAEAFGKLLYAEAYECGVEKAETVVILGDGAAWIWNLRRDHFPGAIEILDYAHASEYVHDLSKELYGEGSAEAKSWAEEKESWLYEGKIQKLIHALKQTKAKGKVARETLANTITYFENHQHQMKYDEYRTKGYHIGSGIAEAACKQLVQQRLKQSGMRWNRQGAEAMLQLKILRTNREWEMLREVQLQEAAWSN